MIAPKANAGDDRLRDAGTSGYSDPAYAAALAEFGEPRLLPRCGGSILVRPIPGSAYADGIGPYPLFSCANWAGLAADLADLGDELVSLALVPDPFGGWSVEELQACFPDRMVPFKEHYVVDLSSGAAAGTSAHHRRNARKALGDVDVEIVSRPAELLDDWTNLYDNLTARHGIKGIAAFSRAAFTGQFGVRGLVPLRASAGGRTVGATLWFVQDDVAYYHLGAYSDRGYELGASFALFASALEHFAEQRLAWLSLGAGAGVDPRSSEEDGLARFKGGWATGTRTAYLCGKILSPDRYEELVRGVGEASYFPAYRHGEFA